jgi:hypothetical protein
VSEVGDRFAGGGVLLDEPVLDGAGVEREGEGVVSEGGVEEDEGLGGGGVEEVILGEDVDELVEDWRRGRGLDRVEEVAAGEAAGLSSEGVVVGLSFRHTSRLLISRWHAGDGGSWGWWLEVIAGRGDRNLEVLGLVQIQVL